MRHGITYLAGLLVLLAIAPPAIAQTLSLHLPETIEAGHAFSAATSGSGNAILYVVGTGHALRRPVRLGETISFGAGDFPNAGHYVAFLAQGPLVETRSFLVLASHQPATLSFLAKPSRLPVNRPDGISGVVYVFDSYRNLMLEPQRVSFVLSVANGSPRSSTVSTKNGVAWIKMNSAAKAGAAQFEASIGSIRERRIIQQVAGDPCSVKISARESGPRILLETEPVRDCSGNLVPDGTIVSFTETYGGSQATVDAPLKRGVARTEMPAYRGAMISAAIGVVMGNEIRWNRDR